MAVVVVVLDIKLHSTNKQTSRHPAIQTKRDKQTCVRDLIFKRKVLDVFMSLYILRENTQKIKIKGSTKQNLSQITV